MSAPPMSDSEEHLGKYVLGYFALAVGVHEPLLTDFRVHLALSVERQEHLVHSFHELHTKSFRGTFLTSVYCFYEIVLAVVSCSGIDLSSYQYWAVICSNRTCCRSFFSSTLKTCV